MGYCFNSVFVTYYTPSFTRLFEKKGLSAREIKNKFFIFFFLEWMSILMPNTPEKNGTESSSVRSVPFSIPDSLSSFLGENGNLPTLASSLHSGEGSTWQNRDVQRKLQ